MTHDDERERILREYVDVVTGRKSEYNFEHRVRAKDGRWKWIRSRGRVVERDAHGRARRLAGINEDVTARKEAEERVCARANRASAACSRFRRIGTGSRTRSSSSPKSPAWTTRATG